MSEQLLRHIRLTDPSTLEDLVLVMAKSIEKSLLSGGAIPGEDYTINDLYSWAMPFALAEFKNEKRNISYATEY